MTNETRNEIHKEFQVERMILFSDAVFAIVITLMAIELRLPEKEGRYTPDDFSHAIVHLIPVILAYIVSFFFIGMIWYQHLKFFSIVKSYDRGLVIRNLLLLFFIGVFPFSASIIAQVNSAYTMTPMIIYFFVILSSLGAQVNLQYYVLYKKPHLRNTNDIEGIKMEYRRKKAGLYASFLMLIIYLILAITLKGTKYVYLAPMCFILMPLLMKYFRRNIKRNVVSA
jgi:uncharacterized membrane protein